jgi:hypothetical protein
MQKKYQIFISSTYEDLRSQREQVIKAVLEMGHIPVGMEMFSAGDEQQWEIIKRQIEQSDYYVVIVSHRYGSMIGEVSYTEREYDYAVSLKIPTLGFIIDESATWPAELRENNKDIQRRLQSFKGKVGGRMVSFWKNEDDLYGRCSVSLMKSFQAYPRVGWARADQTDNSELLAEITRLSRENHTLRSALEEGKRQTEIDSENELAATIEALRVNTRSVSVFRRNATDWTRIDRTTLLSIFEALAPDLLDEAPESVMARSIAFELSGFTDIRDRHPLPVNYLRDWLSDLASLGMITPSNKRHSVQDREKYWTLTDLGRLAHRNIRRDELLKGKSKSDEEEEDADDDGPIDGEAPPKDSAGG